APDTGSIHFHGPGTVDVPAAPITLMTSDGQTASTFSYSIPRQSSRKLVTAGVGSAISTGSVRILPQGTAPTSLVIFSFKSSGITVSEAGVPAILGNAFRMYVETSGTGTTAGNIRSGLAIANSTAGLASVTLELTGLNGASAAPPVTLTVPANGQVAKFVDELFPAVVLPFKGVLRVSGGTTLGLSITGLRARNNERGDFLITTTPPSNQGSAPTV